MTRRPSVTVDRLLYRALKLPLPSGRRTVTHVRDVPVPTSEGVTLMTDMWFPADAADAPVVLVRTPYGRGGAEAITGRFFARHGFRMITQSCRGTGGSTGAFTPFRTEAVDAHATVAWMREQPWFPGRFATYGASYGGYTQWALAREAPPELAAMVPMVSLTDPFATLFPFGAFRSEVALTWTRLMPGVDSRIKVLLGKRSIRRDVTAAAAAMPPLMAYRTATKGEPSGYFEEWLQHENADDGWWPEVDHSVAVERVTVPVLLLGGWQDIFTATTVEQFCALRERGVATALVMGATTHSGFVRSLPTAMPQILAWLRSGLAGERPAGAGSVTLQEVGTGTWTTRQVWPPASHPGHFFLQADGALGPQPAAEGADALRYDPANPTPVVGGELLAMSGGEDNRDLEKRSDVLTYSTDVLTKDLVVGGIGVVTLWWECSGESHDVFVRLLSVAPDGTSTAVTDTIRRVSSVEGEPAEIVVTLPPTYARIPGGHRLRLLVSAGAHPIYLRNHGTREPIAKADGVRATSNRIHRGGARPSSLTLPFLSA